MGLGNGHERSRTGKWWVFLLATALVASSLPSLGDTGERLERSGTGDQTPIVEAQEVRTVWTGELGVDHPVGLAYDSSRGEFLVAGDDPAGNLVLRLGPDEDGLGSVRLSHHFDPSTLAYDPLRDVVISATPDTKVETAASALSRGAADARAYSITDLDLVAPESVAIDAASERWFVLDDGAVVVSTLSNGGDGAAATSRIRVGPETGHVTFNPSDERLYVMDREGSSLRALDWDGGVTAEYDLSSVGIEDPVGIVFAPSSDSTDAADQLNLFVAVSGDPAELGGVTEVSLAAVVVAAAPVVEGTLVRTTATSAWSPGSPDPAGVTYLPGSDELIVVDSEVDEVTGAGWHDVNLWRARRTGSQVGVGTLWGPNAALFAGKKGYSREPTGAGYDASTDTLFVSDDSARKIFVVRRGPDGAFGTGDDLVSAIDAAAVGSTDTEDPEFDPVTGHLFFLDGVGMEIYRVNPVDGIFGNGNDTVTHFDISHLGPKDFEGLAADPARGTLYVGARTTKQIFEITKSGTLVRTISVSGVSQLKYISGLAVAPASSGSGHKHLWIVDRAVDNGPDPNENDGKLFEVADPEAAGPPSANQAPVAQNDSATTAEDTPVDVAVLANDTDPDGDSLTVQIATQPSNGSVTVNPNQSVRFVPAQDYNGPASFTYRAFDGTTTSNLATVSITVTPVNDPPVANPDSATTPIGTAVIVDVLANDVDVDGDALSVTSLTQPASGTASVVTGGVRYTPASGFSGTDTFTYRASDGQAVSQPATVTVKVEDPVVVESRAISESTVRGAVVSGDLTSTYADDNVREAVREEAHAGNKKTRLEHRWNFEVMAGNTMEFSIRAHTTGEPFDISYSTNGSTWVPLARVSATVETLSVVSLPPGLSGAVQIRAMDTVSAAKGDEFRDTIFVDELVIRSAS